MALRDHSAVAGHRAQIAVNLERRMEIKQVGIGLHTVDAAQLDDWRAGLSLLEDGKLLFGGNTFAATALNR